MNAARHVKWTIDIQYQIDSEEDTESDFYNTESTKAVRRVEERDDERRARCKQGPYLHEELQLFKAKLQSSLWITVNLHVKGDVERRKCDVFEIELRDIVPSLFGKFFDPVYDCVRNIDYHIVNLPNCLIKDLADVEIRAEFELCGCEGVDLALGTNDLNLCPRLSSILVFFGKTVQNVSRYFGTCRSDSTGLTTEG